MWWECSECGDQIERSPAPVHCDECGTAGAIFVPLDMSDPLLGGPDFESLREAWLRAGAEHGRATMTSP
jgi:hypothetical protein